MVSPPKRHPKKAADVMNKTHGVKRAIFVHPKRLMIPAITMETSVEIIPTVLTRLLM